MSARTNHVPRIGITTGSNGKTKTKYVEAVERAGGLAQIVLPSDGADILATLDGLVLTGGGDVDPMLYGGRQHDEVYGIDAPRDELELRLVHELIERELPALCICRGLQVLNVALGGSLIEHLPDEVGKRVLHSGVNSDYVPHQVSIEPSSRLAMILATLESNPASSHHQSVRQPGKDLKVVAKSSDGIIEALEHATHTGLIAVQWHPEQTAAKDPAQQRLFDELVRLAGKK